MNLPNSTEIMMTQNTEENIRIQCAAGYYYNTAERLNYLCWFLCDLSAAVSFWSKSVPGVLVMAIIDIGFIGIGIALEYNTKCAADLRKLFDARVLFNTNGEFDGPQIRELGEKAICKTRRHKKNYEVISQTDGMSNPPGKKNWYSFTSDKEPLYAQLECQAQNKWWNDKMVAIRRRLLCFATILVMIGSVLFFINQSLPLAGLINALVIVVIRLIKRIIQYYKYNRISIRIDTIYESALKNPTEDKIHDLQKYIDERRQLLIFGMNGVHKKLAPKLTKLYEEISKS